MNDCEEMESRSLEGRIKRATTEAIEQAFLEVSKRDQRVRSFNNLTVNVYVQAPYSVHGNAITRRWPAGAKS